MAGLKLKKKKNAKKAQREALGSVFDQIGHHAEEKKTITRELRNP